MSVSSFSERRWLNRDRGLFNRELQQGICVRETGFFERRRLARLEVTAEQRVFLPPMRNILTRFRRKRDAREFLIEFDGAPVGYFQLNLSDIETRHYAPGETTCGLEAMCVDQHWQGRGIAQRALRLLPGLVNRLGRDIRQINLTVNCANGAAIRAYHRAGFENTGRVLHIAPEGPQYVMTLKLGAPPGAGQEGGAENA